jgi:hypothetical protein
LCLGEFGKNTSRYFNGSAKEQPKRCFELCKSPRLYILTHTIQRVPEAKSGLILYTFS